ncbi:hypothetical protein [Spelaeicoccus albus]|uniref:Uncharacterized protein n=1 Tax=Spelaeicoccus albus TaxID=1280376 RepID=A0A7Z0IH27_9MICO|nr:hypothetical protein [Spelaeicoccus albus]NYI67503.1 hypothetical protein [Spelaeicoccus albus]
MERDPAHTDPVERTHDAGSTSDALTKVLVRALRALGEAGRADQASRLAAGAWSAMRHSDPAIAEKINGTMHYLARLPDPVDTPHSDHSVRAFTHEGD